MKRTRQSRYSKAIIQAVVQDAQTGMRRKDVAAKHGVSPASVNLWLKRHNKPYPASQSNKVDYENILKENKALHHKVVLLERLMSQVIDECSRGKNGNY